MTNSVPGVYSIAAPNGKQYIGSSVNVRKRWNVHKYHLRKGEHANSHLQAAFDKYGEEAFKFEILMVCEKKDLIFFEQRVIDRFDPEFNQQRIAGSRLGLKHSEETKAKLSRAFRGKKLSEEHKEKVRNSKLGVRRKPFSEEWRRNMSESQQKRRSISTKQDL